MFLTVVRKYSYGHISHAGKKCTYFSWKFYIIFGRLYLNGNSMLILNDGRTTTYIKEDKKYYKEKYANFCCTCTSNF